MPSSSGPWDSYQQHREADNNHASCLWYYDVEGWPTCILALISPDLTQSSHVFWIRWILAGWWFTWLLRSHVKQIFWCFIKRWNYFSPKWFLKTTLKRRCDLVWGLVFLHLGLPGLLKLKLWLIKTLLYWLASVVAAPLHLLVTAVLQTPRQPFKFILWTSRRLTSATL